MLATVARGMFVAEESTLPPCRGHGGDGSLDKFADVLLYFDHGPAELLRTVDVARKFDISRATAYRYMLIIQRRCGLVTNFLGQWEKLSQN